MYLKFNENNELAKLLTEVNIRGVFEDPTQVAALILLMMEMEN